MSYMFLIKRKEPGPGKIGVKPKNFRFITLYVIEHYENVAVWINNTLILDYSETGPITQDKISKSGHFLIKIDGKEAMGFLYFPDQMWVSEKYKDIAARCDEQGWLKIDRHSRQLLEK